MTNCYFQNSADHSYAYSYDNYGNRVEKKTYGNNAVLERYTWTRGRLLERIANASNATIGQYTYDLNGVRYTKTAGGVTTTYFYDGNTLTGENKSDGKRLRYFYDTTGLCGFSYFNGSETQYYTYVKDVLGNIVMIKDHLGLLMTKYTYDEWGNCTVNNLVGTIGNVNPFRYRGYYFDTESGLYYLMSRYYDPEIGQFISMDTVDYLKPDTIGGVDLYAYGLNNPIMYVDPTGHIAITTLITMAIAGLLLFTPVGGTALQVAASVGSYAVMSVWAVGDLIFNYGRGAWADMCRIKWNPFNTDESATLDSNNVSFYKGVPVFRIPEGERSGSFAAIFLAKGNESDDLRHERGHNWQLMMMGIADYGLMIFLPSWLEWSNRSYYERPWEITADIFGGVTGRTHSQADINRGYWYLVVSSLFGMFGYFFLFGEY